MAAHMGIPAGHHATARWSADRVLDMTLVKARALGGEGINVRRRGQPMPVAADTFGAQFVRLEDDKVHGRVTPALAERFGLLKLFCRAKQIIPIGGDFHNLSMLDWSIVCAYA